MILKANGITLTWFQDFATQEKLPEKLAVSISGGCDSSLMLYCLCKTLMEHKLHKKISLYPFNINMLDIKIAENSKLPTQRCYEIISEMFPEINFPLGLSFIDAWYFSCGKGPYAKRDTVRKYRGKFLKKHNINHFITGGTGNPPLGTSKRLDKLISESDTISVRDSIDYKNLKGLPFSKVNKKFVATIYEQENLMYDLFPNTVSCTYVHQHGPCKRCYWCEEKKWAFGMYDGCVT